MNRLRRTWLNWPRVIELKREVGIIKACMLCPFRYNLFGCDILKYLKKEKNKDDYPGKFPPTCPLKKYKPWWLWFIAWIIGLACLALMVYMILKMKSQRWW